MMEWQGPRVFLNKLYREVQTGKEWMWVSFVAKDLKCDGVRSLYKNIKILIVTKSLTIYNIYIYKDTFHRFRFTSVNVFFNKIEELKD